MNAAGIERAILVPPPWTGWDSEYSLAAARAEPQRFAVMALFNLEQPEAQERLKHWRVPGMLGARITPDRAPYAALLTDR